MVAKIEMIIIKKEIKMNKLLQLALLGSVGLTVAACNSGSSSPSPAPTPTPTPSPSPTPGPSAQAIPASFQCLPSNLPTSSSVSDSLKIAYAGNCAVSAAPESINLQSMAVALEGYGTSGFSNYCTGTPIKYNPQTGIGFIVTAAHCVTGTTTGKAAGSPITTANISTYIENNGHNSAWIYQGTTANPLQLNQLTAQIVAVYAASQYCQNFAFSLDTDTNTYECPDIVQSNGDIAVLKIQTQSGKSLNLMSNLILAPAGLTLNSNGNNMMALGYGATNPNGTEQGWNKSNPYLNYINYKYYATNSYNDINAPLTILNGYAANNNSYGIICQGDSGGGDFAWDGTYWNLAGVHSWSRMGNNGYCGPVVANQNTPTAGSTDVRQFNAWINTILTGDTQPTGCANLGSAYACESGSGK